MCVENVCPPLSPVCEKCLPPLSCVKEIGQTDGQTDRLMMRFIYIDDHIVEDGERVLVTLLYDYPCLLTLKLSYPPLS